MKELGDKRVRRKGGCGARDHGKKHRSPRLLPPFFPSVGNQTQDLTYTRQVQESPLLVTALDIKTYTTASSELTLYHFMLK
jgi:hypothetical protein